MSCICWGDLARRVDEDAVDDEADCWLWRSVVVADCWRRDRFRSPGRECHRQLDVHLSAGDGGAQRTITRRRQSAIGQSSGDCVAATIGRLPAGSTSADGRASAAHASTSAIHRTDLPSYEHLQQLLTGPGKSVTAVPNSGCWGGHRGSPWEGTGLVWPPGSKVSPMGRFALPETPADRRPTRVGGGSDQSWPGSDWLPTRTGGATGRLIVDTSAPFDR